MRLYKTTAPDGTTDTGTRTSWTGSQADAGKDRKHFNSALKIPRDKITTDEVDVPTDKQGLLAWLNANAV